MSMSNVEQLKELVRNDVDLEFLKTAAVAIAWEYDRLYRSLVSTPSLDDNVRKEEFGKRRASCAIDALVAACRRHAVPFEFKRLECNGQHKLLVKAGRVIIIQEPITTLKNDPQTSAYKRDLAKFHGLIRQLELDLGDLPGRIVDWSGCTLAVLLHGDSGGHFNQREKALGGLSLAIPDANYEGWVLRFDLHGVAMFGQVPDMGAGPIPNNLDQIQRDEVVVVSKRARRRGTA